VKPGTWNLTLNDNDGIDFRLGSLNKMKEHDSAKTLTRILCMFDKLERDAEKKSIEYNEMQILYIPNPMVDNDLSN